jgi:N,N'-diacetyllegionaminate synthase
MITASQTIQISGREIRQGGRPFLIAEVAQAHDGSLGFAHAFIEVAADAGVDAIKFQTHIADAESTRDEPFRVPFSYEDATRFDYWHRMEFTAAQWQGLTEHARQRNLVFLSSCFSLDAVRMMRQLGMAAWKIGSGELDSDALIDSMSLDGKPILLSTGMSGYDAVTRQVERIAARKVPLGVFQCTTRYPTRLNEVGLNVIDEMHERFGVPVGLSDHSGSVWPSIAAMSRGAPLIEVHIAMHRLQFGPDTPASLNPSQLAQLVEARDAISELVSNPVDKNRTEKEYEDLRASFGRSLALRDSLPAGTIVELEHLAMKKPGEGLQLEELSKIVGRRLRSDVPADRLLRQEDFEP